MECLETQHGYGFSEMAGIGFHVEKGGKEKISKENERFHGKLTCTLAKALEEVAGGTASSTLTRSHCASMEVMV